MIFSVNLPIPPSANNAFVNVTGRGRVPSKEHTAWKRRCAPLVLEAWDRQDKPVIGKPYAVHLRVNVNHGSDIANREKLAVDLLVKTIPGFPGDQWINHLVIERDRDVKGIHLEVFTLPSEARPIGEIIRPIINDIAERMASNG